MTAPASPDTPARRLGPSDLVLSIIHRLDIMIDQGMLVPGQRLVEADLMQELGVGRMPVREALRILAGDGVVELLPHRGARLRRFDALRLAEMLQALTGLTCTAMRLFCERPITPEVDTLLCKANERLNAAIRMASSVECMRGMIGWHKLIYVHCGNSYLLEMLQRVHIEHYSRQIASTVRHEVIDDLCSIYDEMTELMRRGDYPPAEALMLRDLALLSAELQSIQVREGAL